MRKTILYRLFGFGSIPRDVLSELERERIIVLDEGIGGWFVAKHVNGPGKRYRNRTEGFSGCLAVTEARVVCYSYRKLQINISNEDPKLINLYVDTPEAQRLSISFESSYFREGWEGVVEFRFKTEKSLLFRDALVSIGAQQGTAAEADRLRR